MADFDPIANGATKFDPTANGATPAQTHPLIHGASDVMRTLGLGAFPEAATSVNALIHGGHIQANDPFTTPDQVRQIQQEGPMHIAKNAVGEASYLAPIGKVAQGAGLLAKGANAAVSGAARGAGFGFGTSQPGQEVGNTVGGGVLGGILGPLLSSLGSGKLTQRGLNNLTKQAKNASVQRGESTTGNEFFNRVEDALNGIDPHGLSTDLRQAVQDRLNKLPSMGETKGNPSPGMGSQNQYIGQKTLNADWFHSLRQTMDKEINWARQTNTPTTEQAAKLIRQVASDHLHQMAPETELLDKLNHLYYSPVIKGGKIPLTNISAKYPESLTGAPSTIINALGAILGIDAGTKLLKK